MKDFDHLLHILDELLGPNGCPWDQKQSMHSMRYSILEEAYEVIEAIDSGDKEAIKEELGDLFFNVCFLGRLAEKEQKFLLQDALRSIVDKLVRRHPHVFGTKEAADSDAVLEQWETIKDKEKNRDKEDILEGIPKALPALYKTQKIVKKLRRIDKLSHKQQEKIDDQDPEKMIAKQLFDIVVTAEEQGIDAEMALGKFLTFKS